MIYFEISLGFFLQFSLLRERKGRKIGNVVKHDSLKEASCLIAMLPSFSEKRLLYMEKNIQKDDFLCYGEIVYGLVDEIIYIVFITISHNVAFFLNTMQ